MADGPTWEDVAWLTAMLVAASELLAEAQMAANYAASCGENDTPISAQDAMLRIARTAERAERERRAEVAARA